HRSVTSPEVEAGVELDVTEDGVQPRPVLRRGRAGTRPEERAGAVTGPVVQSGQPGADRGGLVQQRHVSAVVLETCLLGRVEGGGDQCRLLVEYASSRF